MPVYFEQRTMRICRFTTTAITTPRFGLVEGESILPLVEGEVIGSPNPRTDTAIPISEVKLLAPVVPSKIVCVGRN